MKILYSMSAMYPFGTPYAARVTNICRLLRSLGHEVVLFCDYYSENVSNEQFCERYENVEVRYTSRQRDTWAKLTVMHRTPKLIERYIREHKIDLIISSSAANRFERIRSIARKSNIPLILEINEKYHFTNWELGKFDPRYFEFKRCWERHYKTADGFLTISTFLQNEFLKTGKPTVRIPTIMDVEFNKNLANTYEKKEDSVSYNFSGGLGGGKDLLGEFISVLESNNDSLKKNHTVDIYGPSETEVIQQTQQFGISVLNPKRVHVHGRIPQKEVPKAIAMSEFGLILRPNRESSDAGFPTKIAEYMSIGTPIIANKTSDIAMYIKDGENGFLLDDLKMDTIRTVIQRIDRLSDVDYQRMRHAAQEQARRVFDYREYCYIMDGFIDAVVRGNR